MGVKPHPLLYKLNKLNIMKKILFVMAIMASTMFVSCGFGAGSASAKDSVADSTVVVDSDSVAVDSVAVDSVK